MQTRPSLFTAIGLVLVLVVGTMTLIPGIRTAVAQGVNPQSGEGVIAAATAQPPALNGEGANAQAQDSANPAPAAVPAPNAAAGRLSYYYILGANLQPRASDSTIVYDGNGCVHVTGGTNIRLIYPVILPEGSVIKYVNLYYYDSSIYDMTLWLTRYQPGTFSADVISVNSNGSAGYGSVQSIELTHPFDGANYQYTLNFGWGAIDGSQQVCGIRVDYYAPLGATFLPSINR